jgi:hypothetical protein
MKLILLTSLAQLVSLRAESYPQDRSFGVTTGFAELLAPSRSPGNLPAREFRLPQELPDSELRLR